MFLFIQNKIKVNFDLPVEIIPNYIFQEATEQQIKEINGFLKDLYKFIFGKYDHPYEKFNVKNNRKTKQSSLKSHKYYVIEIKQNPASENFDLQIASNLLPI